MDDNRMNMLGETPMQCISRLSAEKEALRASLKKMLEVYWGDGDGYQAPDFILRAKRLAGKP